MQMICERVSQIIASWHHRLTQCYLAQWNKHLAQYYWKQGNDIGKALEYSKLGLSLATSTGDWDNTSTLGLLNQTSSLMSVVGNYTGAREYAQKAQLAAELSGNLPAQATALCTQANCSVALADFTEAATLCRRAREIFSACGLEGCSTDLTVQMHEAEVHLLKTEYEARVINDSVSSAAARGLPISFRDTLAKLNLVAIGIASAAAPEYVLELLSTCRLQFQSLGYPRGLWYCDMTLGDLNLAQGDSQAARAILVSCYTSTRGKADGGAMFCLERLADYRHRLYDPQTTLGWTCVYIGAARKTGNKLALMKGLACIAEIFIAWGDDSTALSILEVTLSRFTYMGVHRWRADCFERMGEIYERRGQLVKACELWTSARPLFERSSQAQAVARLDSRLASVRSSSQSVVIPTSAITFPILTQSG
jgi:tetratricopeptide (TPR) repeat protein